MLLPIFLVVLADVFALTLVLPLLAIYAEQFGATPLQATLLVSVFAACQLVSGPLLGRISDRVGRKPMLVVSQIGTLIGLLIMAGAQSLAVLFLARIIDGATAGNLSLAQAYIADHTEPEHRSKSFALIGIAFGLGFFLGPSITGYLAGYGLRAPIYAAAALSLASIVCSATLLKNESPRARADDADLPGGRRLGVEQWGAYARYFEQPVMAGLLAQFFLFAFAFATFTSGFALFAERRLSWDGHPFTPREIGMVFAYAGFLGILLQGGLIGRLVARFGEPVLVSAGFVAMAVGYFLLGLTSTTGLLVVVATFVAFGQGVLRPTLTSLVSQLARRDEQGVVLGLSQSLTSLAQMVAPPIGGWLIGHNALGSWAFVAAFASAGGLVAARWGSSRAKTAAGRREASSSR
jgi:DHA1 family tetracycline resistance protein-like MFS transporter